MHAHLFKGYGKEHYIQNYKTKLDQFLSWSSWKSIKNIFFEYIPNQNLGNAIHYEFWYLYEMKAWLSYIRLAYIQFFLGSLEIQANQGNIHPTLAI